MNDELMETTARLEAELDRAKKELDKKLRKQDDDDLMLWADIVYGANIEGLVSISELHVSMPIDGLRLLLKLTALGIMPTEVKP